MIESVSHITFVVRDLARMAYFLATVFDAREVYDSADHAFSIAPEKFFLIGGTWIAVMQGDPPCGRSYDHVAFTVSEEEFNAYSERVRRLGVEICPGRERVPGEGRSLYFYDYDDHLFELHTGTLAERLAHYAQH